MTTFALETHPLQRRDADALLAIYEEALPLGERKPNDAIVHYLSRDDYRVLGASEGGRLRGFAILFTAPKLPVALLEYMAVAQGFRGGGLGALLFYASLQAVTGRNVLIEVDSDRAATDPQDPATRRKRFYRQRGCKTVAGLNYQMPMVNTQRPPAMELLVHRNGQKGPIAKADLQAWLRAIFVSVYGLDSNPPQIARMMSPIQDPVVLI